MIDHVLIYVIDLEKGKHFYQKIFEPLGYAISFGEEGNFWSFDVGDGALFEIAQHKGNDTLTPCHIAFLVQSKEQIHEFHSQALKAGGRCNGEPGPRPQYTKNYYAAFIIDPNGHNIEAVLAIE